MRGIVVPERTEDFTSDPVELFFDLAYVFAFSQLVGLLVHDHDWAGVGRVALLFWLLWLPWQQFTWSANAVSGNGRAVRTLFLVATATSVPMAASVSTAYGPGGPVFAVSLGTIYLIGVLTMVLGVDAGTSVRAAALRWMAVNLLGLVVLVGGAFLDGDAREIAWVLTISIVVAAMVQAGGGEWIIRSGHFAERHGLIVIVALGEVIVAIGGPVVSALETGSGLPGETVVALVASGTFGGLLWWSYFDRVGPALEHRAAAVDGDNARGRFVRDVYTWAHAPLVFGIVLAAAALEEIALHPGDPVPTAFRVMLAGGILAGVLGVVASIHRAFGVVAKERLVAGAALTAVLCLAGSVKGAALLVVVDALIAGALVVEHVRIEGPLRGSAPAG